MPVQIISLCECFVTLGTLERFFPSVSSQVNSKITLESEVFVTNGASVLWLVVDSIAVVVLALKQNDHSLSGDTVKSSNTKLNLITSKG